MIKDSKLIYLKNIGLVVISPIFRCSVDDLHESMLFRRVKQFVTQSRWALCLTIVLLFKGLVIFFFTSQIIKELNR